MKTIRLKNVLLLLLLLFTSIGCSTGDNRPNTGQNKVHTMETYTRTVIRGTLKQGKFRRMPSSGMWRHIDLVWTDVSEERIAFIFRVDKSICEEPTWAGGSDCSHLLTLFPRSRIFLLSRWKRSVYTRSTWRPIPEDGILHSHGRENLKSYKGNFTSFQGHFTSHIAFQSLCARVLQTAISGALSFRTTCILCGFRRRHFRRILWTFVCGVCNSVLALGTDCMKACLAQYTSSWGLLGRPVECYFSTLPPSLNCWYRLLMLLSSHHTRI
jgi:hypothetical protein